MSLGEKILGLVDLTVETFFAVCLSPVMGMAAWRDYPHSPYARRLLEESRDLSDEVQGK